MVFDGVKFGFDQVSHFEIFEFASKRKLFQVKITR